MDLQNSPLEGRTDWAQFLDKFKEPAFPASEYLEEEESPAAENDAEKPSQYEKTFEKLEQKIEELEARFDAATGQNQLILAELARQREVISNQKDRDAFVENLSHTIANLKASVEALSRSRQTPPLYNPAPVPPRAFDVPSVESAYYQMNGAPSGTSARPPARKPVAAPKN